jgi:hypothetical protein
MISDMRSKAFSHESLKHAGYFAGSTELLGFQSSVRKGEAGSPFLL